MIIGLENQCSVFMRICLFLLLYIPSQQLWSWQDGQFTSPHFFLGNLEQAVNQYFVHILSLVTDKNPSYDSVEGRRMTVGIIS